jgi:hypothetical protein
MTRESQLPMICKFHPWTPMIISLRFIRPRMRDGSPLTEMDWRNMHRESFDAGQAFHPPTWRMLAIRTLPFVCIRDLTESSQRHEYDTGGKAKPPRLQ